MTAPLRSDLSGRPVSRFRLAVLVSGAALLFLLFAALGVWQIERLGWKRDLVARVDARVHAAPVAAPGRANWAGVGRASHEYLRVQARGRYLHDEAALVQAATERGAGFWVLTPLQRDDGTVLWVNRGFVPNSAADAVRRGDASTQVPEGPTEVTGLLRLSEPGGGFLRDNDPAADRWFSRDVAALSAARRLPAAQVAPYFIDADAAPGAADGAPVGGLTVIRFSDNHLPYALTWFALALMAAAAAGYLLWDARRRADGPAPRR